MRLRNFLYMAFMLWPFALGMLLASLMLLVLEDRPAVRVFSLIFSLGGFAFNVLWAYYVDRSGLLQRVHDFLGLTRNPFTGKYGATQKEIEADARRVRDSVREKKKD